MKYNDKTFMTLYHTFIALNCVGNVENTRYKCMVEHLIPFLDKFVQKNFNEEKNLLETFLT